MIKAILIGVAIGLLLSPVAVWLSFELLDGRQEYGW
jgi:predicted permease